MLHRENHLNLAARTLGISALTLSKESGVSHSLLVKWFNGERPISTRSRKLGNVAQALLRLDREGVLRPLIAPYQSADESDEEALYAFLLHDELPALPARVGQSVRQVSGEYVKETRIFLGQKGFQKAALAMLDYLTVLPPGQQMIVLCQGRYEWITKDIGFVLKFIAGMQRAVKRGARLLLVNRRGYSIAETAVFAGPWLAAHLKGYIRSLYYDGEMPEEIRFAATIPGYWSGRAEEDEEVEDHLYVSMQTDARDIRREQALIERYVRVSDTVSQYDFLTHPGGNEQNLKLWRQGELPAWNDGSRPDGGFLMLTALPGFGVMTRTEFMEVAGGDAPDLPEYLFSPDGQMPEVPCRIILCREDVREALARGTYEYNPLNRLTGRSVLLPAALLRRLLERVLSASGRDDFQIALMPRVAIKALGLELVTWRNSASVGWLRKQPQSVFSNDKATSGSFYGYVDYIWSKQLAGWRDQPRVTRQIRKWLSGQELTIRDEDSTMVKNWNAMPKE